MEKRKIRLYPTDSLIHHFHARISAVSYLYSKKGKQMFRRMGKSEIRQSSHKKLPNRNKGNGSDRRQNYYQRNF